CALLICVLFACQKDNGNSSPNIIGNASLLIVGKWNLQKEKYTVYVDSVKQTDTTVNASAGDVSYADFNRNGSYVSISHYFIANNFYTVASEDSLSGTYSIAGSTFKLSSYLGGLNVSPPGGSLSTTTVIPVITPVSHLVQIIALTQTILTIHSEYVVNSNVPTGVTKTYKYVSDLYYTR
ncbi:MAG: hypothetical protein JWP37_960, partial [Mucilaginibacter sp.]|nr:hypothetical protein [Mucilaginibacter sp.]